MEIEVMEMEEVVVKHGLARVFTHGRVGSSGRSDGEGAHPCVFRDAALCSIKKKESGFFFFFSFLSS